MDETHRQSLLERRARLDRERRSAAAREGLAPLIAAAGAAGIALALHDPDAAPDWLAGMVPAGLTHLDWSAVPGADAIEASAQWSGRAALVGPWLARLPAAARLFVVTANGANAIAELDAADAPALLPAIVGLDPFEMWLSAPSAGLLIELRHPWLRALVPD